MKVGMLTASSSRQAGGLFWAMSSLVGHLAEGGCQAQVFAGRDIYSEEDRSAWGEVPLHVLDKAGPSAFGYTPGLKGRLGSENFDLVHTHGLWMYSSVAASGWGRSKCQPWLVSPHGMLDQWAVRNSRWIKRLAGLLYENQHLHGAACLHALCDAEAEAFRTYGLTNPIAVIPNGVDLSESLGGVAKPDWAESLPPGAQVLLFLGRLHPKKGLANLLRAWARDIKSKDDPWFLVIAGWDQNGHKAELEELVESYGIADTVLFVGPQFGQEKAASLSRADAFVLPSFSEGLPMAVLEAWAYELPVLMSPQCNLPMGFATGAAISIEPEVEAIFKGLCALIGMSQQEREQMGARGRSLVEERFCWSNLATQMCALYAWLLGQAERPACVRLE
jgi:poly(glycerol-phosphate) alpha-glucosyltransferase